MTRPSLLLLGAFLSACAAPPEAATSEASASGATAAVRSIGTLSPAFRDHQVGARRVGGEACTPSPGALQYVESLEYFDAPAVVFGVDPSGCVAEIRTDVGTGAFEHAVALATQRLGPPDGEDRARCEATGTPLQCVYWDRPEGRFEVVRAGTPGQPEFVLRPLDAPLVYPRLCEGPVTR